MLHKPVRSALDSFQHVKNGGFDKDHLLMVNIPRLSVIKELFFLFRICIITRLLREHGSKYDQLGV